MGYGLHNADDGNEVDTSILSNNRIDKEDNNLLFSVEETVYEIGHKAEAEAVLARFGSLFSSRYVAIVPIIGGNDRLGTLLLTRSSSPFTDDDLILAEYGATIVGMEILRGRADEYGDGSPEQGGRAGSGRFAFLQRVGSGRAYL